MTTKTTTAQTTFNDKSEALAAAKREGKKCYRERRWIATAGTSTSKSGGYFAVSYFIA